MPVLPLLKYLLIGTIVLAGIDVSGGIAQNVLLTPTAQVSTEDGGDGIDSREGVTVFELRTENRTDDAVAASPATINTTELEPPARNLVEVAQSIEAIQSESAQTQKAILNVIDRAIEDTLSAVKENRGAAPSVIPSTRVQVEIVPVVPTYIRPERTEKKEEPRTSAVDPVERRVREVKKGLVDEVKRTLNTPAPELKDIERVRTQVDAALLEVEKIVEEEKRIDVNVTEVKRAVGERVDELKVRVEDERVELAERGGLLIYRDSDKDGLSDYDEKNVYRTDPLKAKTVSGELSDGDKVRLGINPSDPANKPIEYENPLEGEHLTLTTFRVTEIEVALPAPAVGIPSFEAPPRAESSKPEAIVFRGTGLPNSYVTLYIFSTPIIVTVKTDNGGNWEYQLTEELPDGDHTMYVATVDNTGKILAKSEAVPFVKEAAAVSFAGTAVGGVPEKGFFAENLLPIAFFLFGIALGATLILIGMRRGGAPVSDV